MLKLLHIKEKLKIEPKNLLKNKIIATAKFKKNGLYDQQYYLKFHIRTVEHFLLVNSNHSGWLM